MENTTILKVELNINAQKIVNQIILNNETIEKEIKEGIESAFEKFDFKAEIEKATGEAIRNEVRNAINHGSIKEIVHKKSDEIITSIADEHFNKLYPKQRT